MPSTRKRFRSSRSARSSAVGVRGAAAGRQRVVEREAGDVLGIAPGEGDRDRRAPVAALGDVALVAEPAHQLRPGVGDPLDSPAGRGRLAAEAVAGQRGHDHVEGVAASPPWATGSVSGPSRSRNSRTEPGQPWVSRSGTAVGLGRAQVDEVDLEAVDLGRELGHRVQPPRHPVHLVLALPVGAELPRVGERQSLRPVVDVSASGQRVRASRSRRSAIWRSSISTWNGVTASIGRLYGADRPAHSSTGRLCWCK